MIKKGIFLRALGGGGCNPKKTLPQILNLGLVFPVFSGFFCVLPVFFGFSRFGFSRFSILANFDWFNGFLLSGSCWL